MSDYPNNFKTRDSRYGEASLEACIEKAGQLLGSMSDTLDEFADVVQEMSMYAQSSSTDYSVSQIGNAQRRIQRALESAQEALARVEEQERYANRKNMNVVYGLPPTGTTVYGLPPLRFKRR